MAGLFGIKDAANTLSKSVDNAANVLTKSVDNAANILTKSVDNAAKTANNFTIEASRSLESLANSISYIGLAIVFLCYCCLLAILMKFWEVRYRKWLFGLIVLFGFAFIYISHAVLKSSSH